MKRLLKVVLRLLLFIFILVNIITAFQAYKFTHFYNAGEVTTKLDANRWDKAGDILFGINVAKKTNTISTDSTFETIYLSTKDNIKLQGWYLKTDSMAKGTVVMFHGHGSTKSAIFTESEAFRKMGYNTFLIDFRGTPFPLQCVGCCRVICFWLGLPWEQHFGLAFRPSMPRPVSAMMPQRPRWARVFTARSSPRMAASYRCKPMSPCVGPAGMSRLFWRESLGLCGSWG